LTTVTLRSSAANVEVIVAAASNKPRTIDFMFAPPESKRSERQMAHFRGQAGEAASAACLAQAP
jgi:hypothetical protein